jgi:hypothetical protein
MQPIGSAQRIMTYQANGGRSASGAWMFTAGGCPGTFRIDPLGTSDVTVYEEVSLSVYAWADDDTLDGCNPSMSPHESDGAVRVMYVAGYGSWNHHAYWLCGVRGDDRRRIVWDDSENPYIDEPQWSNHPDYAAAKASSRFIEAPYDAYIFNVWTGSRLKILEGNYSFPYLWIDPATIGTRGQAPRVPVTPAWHLAMRGGVLHSSGVAGVARVLDARGRAVVTTALTGDDRLAANLAAGVYTVVCRADDGRVLTRTLAVRGGVR